MRQLLILLSLMLLLGFGLPVFAKAKNAPVVREHILVQLQQAQKLIDEKLYVKSQRTLTELAEGKLSAYELSQVYQLLAFQFYKSDQYRKSIPYYQKILLLEGLPQFTRNETLYSLSQLFFSLEDYVSANKNLTEWFKTNPDPNVQAYELHGQVYYQLKQYPAAITVLNKAIEKNNESNKPPKQNWLQMLQSMYYESGDLRLTIETVEQLIKYYPKKVYWLQLAGLYGEQGKSELQLSVLDAAYTQGLLDKQSELKTLAYLYIEKQVPYKAAQILQKGIKLKQIEANEKNLVLLASAWRLAQEIRQSIQTLQIAAKKASHGNLYAELARLYLSDEQFTQAEQAAKLALKKGALKKIGQTYNTMGIALLKQYKYLVAKQAFEKARQDPSAIKLAMQWQSHLKNIQRNLN